MANNDEKYPLGRQAAEIERLNIQHRLLVRAAGYHLHPSIKRKLPSESKIAEIATGTGIFLKELSQQLPPQSTLDGYDISSDAFTPPDELPKNVHLSILDAKQLPPGELQGKYDVVLTRFINIALQTPDDWLAVAKHASSLLRPGGAIQWIEANFQGINVVLLTEPETKTTAIVKGTKQVGPMLQNANWYVSNLLGVLSAAGFTEVKRLVTSTDRLPEDRNPMSKVAFSAVEGLLRFQTSMQMEGALSIEEVGQVIAEMKEEVDSGAYVRVDVHHFIAWKGI